MRYTCPHQKRIRLENTLGVVVYMHVDNDLSCDTMNKFSFSTSRVLSTTCQHSKYHATRAVKASLKSCEQARKRMLLEMSKLVGNTVKTQQMLETWWMALGLEYLDELTEAFGAVGVQNLAIVSNSHIETPVSKGNRPRYRMKDLAIAEVASVADKLSMRVSNERSAREGLFPSGCSRRARLNRSR